MSQPCPQCQHPNRDRARFCAECGAVLAAEPLLNQEAAAGSPAAPAHEPDASLTADAGPQLDLAVVSATNPEYDPENGSEREPVSSPDPGAEIGAAQGWNEDLPAAGALVADRYCVLAAARDAAGMRLYEVEDRGVCRACGMEACGSDEEPFCTNCGAHLLQLAGPWPHRRLQEVAPENGGDLAFTWEGRTFAVAADAAPAADHSGGPSGGALPAAAPTAADGFVHGSCLAAGYRSDVGAARRGRANEDSIFVLTAAAIADSRANPAVGLYLVADGMGGHEDGELAGRMACEIISAHLLHELRLPALPGFAFDAGVTRDLLMAAVKSANRRIYAAACARGSSMGTTAVLALVLDDEVCIANVGDSRAYLWSCGGLRQLTEDHSHVAALVRKGLLAEAEIYTHPRRNEIYRSLGAGESVEVDCCQTSLLPGDLLLLCSDGLWEMLRSEGIADVLELNLGDPQLICDELVRRANLAGGEDNISVVAVRAGA